MTDAAMAECLVITSDRTPEQWRHACNALGTVQGLDLFRRRLSAAGRLTDDAMTAIRNRMDAVKRGRG